MVTIGVAVAIPEPWATELQNYRTSVGDTMAATIPTHITLLPPTEVSEDELEKIETHLEKAAVDVPAFEVHLRGTGTFRPVSPVVFVTLVEGISQCEQLAHAVRRGPLARGPGLPLPPPRHHRPRPRRGRSSTRPSTSWPTSSASSTSTTSTSTSMTTSSAGRPPATSPSSRVPDWRARHRRSVKGRIAEVRQDAPALDHALRTQAHYGSAKGSQQAGAVTYFGFLSVFPVLALAFFAVGYIAQGLPGRPGHAGRGHQVDVSRADRHG